MGCVPTLLYSKGMATSIKAKLKLSEMVRTKKINSAICIQHFDELDF